MNKSAETHLTAAKEYVAKGETFYRKAAEEIVAAQKADPTLTLREVDRKNGWYAGKAGHIVRWITSGAYTEQALPRSEPEGAVAKRHARSVLREAPPEQIAEMMDSPEIRANVSKALDTHYRKRAAGAAEERRERKVEDHGGEEEHVEHEHRQRLAELVNVMRGAVSALRFAASQAKGLDLAEDDTGAAEELAGLIEEIVGFGSMLREYLGGRSITDEDLAQLIGEQQ